MGNFIVFGGIISIIVTGIVFTTIMCYLRIKGKQHHNIYTESTSGNNIWIFKYNLSFFLVL